MDAGDVTYCTLACIESPFSLGGIIRRRWWKQSYIGLMMAHIIYLSGDGSTIVALSDI